MTERRIREALAAIERDQHEPRSPAPGREALDRLFLDVLAERWGLAVADPAMPASAAPTAGSAGGPC